jgi:hypothetical protein
MSSHWRKRQKSTLLPFVNPDKDQYIQSYAQITPVVALGCLWLLATYFQSSVKVVLVLNYHAMQRKKSRGTADTI